MKRPDKALPMKKRCEKGLVVSLKIEKELNDRDLSERFQF